MEAQKPDIRPDVNKEEKKQGGGLLAGLLSRLGLGAAGGGAGIEGAASVGGEGLLDSLARLGLGSGIFSTKAGLVAMLVAGSTVAGGISLVGYKTFQSGGAWPQNKISAFFAPHQAPQAQTAATAPGAPAAPGHGSDSLNDLAQANAGYGAPPPAAAPQQAAGASAVVVTAAPAQAPSSPVKAAAKAAAAAKPALEGGGKDGAAGDWHVAGGNLGSAPSSNAAIAAKAAKTAAISAFQGSRGMGALSKGTVGAGRGLGTALGQAHSVLGQQTGAQSSYSAGRTYDSGSSGGGQSIGGTGASGSNGGTGTGAGAGPAGNSPTQSGSDNGQFTNVPPPSQTGTNSTAWQGLVNTATLLMTLAAALIALGAHIVNPKTDWFNSGQAQAIAMVIAGIAAIIGIIVIGLGAAIGGYGQQMQGSMFTLAGGLLTVSSLALMYGAYNAVTDGGTNAGITGLTYPIMFASGALAVGAALYGYMSGPTMSSSLPTAQIMIHQGIIYGRSGNPFV